MQRGRFDVTGDLLEEITNNPHLAPSRVTSRAGATYDKLQLILQAELVTMEQTTKKRRRLILTEKGRKFLFHYRTLKQIMPQT